MNANTKRSDTTKSGKPKELGVPRAKLKRLIQPRLAFLALLALGNTGGLRDAVDYVSQSHGLIQEWHLKV